MLHSNRSRSPYEDGTKPMTVHHRHTVRKNSAAPGNAQHLSRHA
jgi:hypothetical protein